MNKRSLLCVVFLFYGSLLFAQDAYNRMEAPTSEEVMMKQQGTRLVTRPGEKYMIVDHISFFGGYQRYRYFPGENIRFRLHGVRTKFNETIGEISDSTFTFVLVNEAVGRMEHREVSLGDLRTVKTTRRIPWVSEGSFLLPLAGLIYVGADFFNRGVDGKHFTTDQQTLLVGGGFVAAGIVCYKLTFSSIKIGKKNKIRILETY